MEIYSSKRPNDSPVKKVPSVRQRGSILSNDLFDNVARRSSAPVVVGVTTGSGSASVAKSQGRSLSSLSLSQHPSYQHHARSQLVINNSGMTSPFDDLDKCDRPDSHNVFVHPRLNGYNDDEYDLGSKMSAINEEILAAKLRKIALEQEKRLANGAASPTSAFGSRKTSCSDFSHHTIERFYVTEGSGSTSPYTNESIEDDDTRSSCNSVISHIRTNIDSDESQIRSPRGTVRGNRNRVRASIAAFQAVEEAETPGVTVKPNYPDRERGKIVLYSTTLSVVRDTYERCQRVRQVLLTHMVRYEERDLFMNKEMQVELMERLDLETITVPWVFIHGRLLGDATRIHELNESGDLRMLLRPFPKVTLRIVCEGCGGYRYVPCPICHGSKKSLFRNHGLQEFRTLRCTNCNENGLVNCEKCLGVED